MSMLAPVTCSALTVIDPALPPDEVVCCVGFGWSTVGYKRISGNGVFPYFALRDFLMANCNQCLNHILNRFPSLASTNFSDEPRIRSYAALIG